MYLTGFIFMWLSAIINISTPRLPPPSSLCLSMYQLLLSVVGLPLVLLQILDDTQGDDQDEHDDDAEHTDEQDQVGDGKQVSNFAVSLDCLHGNNTFRYHQFYITSIICWELGNSSSIDLQHSYSHLSFFCGD